MEILDNNTVVVSSFSDLNEAITGVNDYNYIYFNADITMTAGINIPLSKNGLVIDGTYEGVTHTYTDMNSASPTSALRFIDYNSSVPTMGITIKNMKIEVRNYYGVVFVGDSAYAANTTVTFDNVTTNGTQPIYNNFGITNIIDCTMNVGTGTRDGEVAEAHIVNIGGNTTINHTYTGHSTFFFRGGNGQGLNILPGANVTINAARNLFYFEGNGHFTVGNGATFNLNSPYGFTFSNANPIQNVLFDTNSTTICNRTSNTGGATLSFSQNFTINSGANLYMASSTALSNPHIYAYLTGATINIDDPASMILIDTNTNVFYFTGTTNLNINTRQINLWNTTPATGDIYNLPTNRWQKVNDGIISLTGTATNTTTTISSNNFTAEDLLVVPAVALIQLRSAQVFSAGYLPRLNLNAIPEDATSISGFVGNSHGVRVTTEDEVVFGSGNATTGRFEVPITVPLYIGEVIAVLSSDNNYLYNEKRVTVVYPGDLYIYYVPPQTVFSINNRISTAPLLYGRLDPNWKIQVYDSRIVSSDWKLYATINTPLTSNNNHVLENALVYVAVDDAMTILSDNNTLIYTGEDNEGVPKITDVTYNNDKGLLANLTNTPVYNGETYTTDIFFDIEP